MAIGGKVEAILARCLLDPDFAAQLSGNPDDTLAPYHLDDHTAREIALADMERIRSFSGFIAKVQHNHLWESFPVTRALMRFHGVELKFFTEFRARQQEVANQGRDERIVAFLDFLTDWLGTKRSARADLREALAHERAVWELFREGVRAPATAACGTEALTWQAYQRLIPRFAAPLRILELRYDPAELITRATKGMFRGIPRARRPKALLYTIDHRDASLRILNVDRLTAHLVGLIDGRRTVRSVIAHARRSGLGGVRPLAFRDFFESARKSNLVALLEPEAG